MTESPVRRLADRKIRLQIIFDAVGLENIPTKINRRALLHDLDRARSYYNTRLDFDRNRRQQKEILGKLARIQKHATRLAELLNEKCDHVGALRELHLPCSMIKDLRDSLLALSVQERNTAIKKRSSFAPLKWSLNAELVARLADVFSVYFGKEAGYARTQDESAPANVSSDLYAQCSRNLAYQDAISERSATT
jgi:hypothetical protein